MIEVTLAVGIVAFGLLSTVGMMAVGLTSFRQAIDNTAQAQITQKLVGAIRQTDFSRLETLNSESYYFDETGVQMTHPADIAAKKYLYTAGISVAVPASLPTSGLSRSAEDIKSVEVSITSLSSPQTAFRFVTVVSDNGS